MKNFTENLKSKELLISNMNRLMVVVLSLD